MGPLIPQGIIGPEWNHVLAVLLGMGFGFALESSGFSSTRKLVGVFYGYDFTVLRVFFTAAITATVGLLYFNYMGWVDLSMIYLSPLFLYSSLVGGVIMGMGFIVGGFCPGTSVCAAGIGKIDGMVFTGGMFIGILIFSEIFPLIEDFYYGSYYGYLQVYEMLGISAGLFTFILILVAIFAFYVTSLIKKRVKPVVY